MKIFHSIHQVAIISIGVSLSISITSLHSTTKNLTLLCSVSVSITSPVTCFHRMTKNITLLHSVQFLIPSPITCTQWLTKSSIQSNLPCRNHTSNSCVRVLLKGMKITAGLTLGILFTTTTICTPLISHGAPKILPH